jgi:PLP dependent protein
MNHHPRAFFDVLHTLQNAARATGRPDGVRLLAVSKTRPADAIADLADSGQHAFGENYVQEARGKITALANRGLEWHLIGHLQSNKARETAELFDWVQTLDRPKLVSALGQHRPSIRPPLNVLIQVNIDDEASKHGCRPDAVAMLADAIEAQPGLALRGLMAIPAPHRDPESRRPAFRRMKQLFDELGACHPRIDTLSMGMSDDYTIAIEEGATMVRIGTALFGARPSNTDTKQ